MALSTARSSFKFALLITLVAFGGCRKGQEPAQTNAGSTTQTEIQPQANVAPEKPSFEGQIEHVSMYPVPNRRQDLAVTLVVTVRNSGSASAAQSWNLEVSSPGRRFPTILQPVQISGYVELPGTKGPKVDLAKEDLALKTAGVAITKGSNVTGVLTYVLPKTFESEISNNNTSFTVNFKDSQGNQYHTQKYLIGSKAKDAGR